MNFEIEGEIKRKMRERTYRIIVNLDEELRYQKSFLVQSDACLRYGLNTEVT